MQQKSILLGVVGDSAAGKTTISSGIAKILGEDRVTILCTDDYHRYDRAQRKEMGISALDPACNYMAVMEQHLDLLRRGRPILKPIYNHHTGGFDAPEYIEPAEFIIAEGLLGFHNRGLRRNFDVKVYLQPETELRYAWKIARDTKKRGYTEEQVRASLAKRVNDSKDFIEPQTDKADILVNFHRPEGEENEVGKYLNARLFLRPTLPHPNLEEIADCGKDGDGVICTNVIRQGDWLTETLDISGTISAEKAAQVEKSIWNRLRERSPRLADLQPDILGAYMEDGESYTSHPLGLTQLMIAYQLLLAREGLREELREISWK